MVKAQDAFLSAGGRDLDESRFLTIKGTRMIGRHLILDLFDIINPSCDESLTDMFRAACLDTGATIMDVKVQSFGPGCGTTGAIILSESHLTWHHYPEDNAMFVDLFTCGQCDPKDALPRIKEFLKPGKVNQGILNRGVVS